jgi:hypothetical protein
MEDAEPELSFANLRREDIEDDSAKAAILLAILEEIENPKDAIAGFQSSI